MYIIKTPLCRCPIVTSLSVRDCMSGAYLLSSWPNLGHTLPTECLWVQNVQLPWALFLEPIYNVKCEGHSKMVRKFHIRSTSSLPLRQSDSLFTHVVPLIKEYSGTLNVCRPIAKAYLTMQKWYLLFNYFALLG